MSFDPAKELIKAFEKQYGRGRAEGAAEIERLQARVEELERCRGITTIAEERIFTDLRDHDAQIREWKKEEVLWKETEAGLLRLVEELEKRPTKYQCLIKGIHHITDKQINAAVEQINNWKTEDSVYTDYESGWDVLNKINIFKCERCGGSGRTHNYDYPQDCPDCNGKGWTKEESDG